VTRRGSVPSPPAVYPRLRLAAAHARGLYRGALRRSPKQLNYVKAAGVRSYVYRAVDQYGQVM